MRARNLILAATLTGSVSGAAFAQEMYYGGGLAYTSATSDNVAGGSGESDFSAGMLSLIIGQRHEAGSGFWALEASADLSFGAEAENPATGFTCYDGSSGSYFCKQKATIRMVGIYGMPVGQGTEVFGSLGLGVLFGENAVNTNAVDSGAHYGLTVGLGLSHELANGMTLRGEVIHDRFDRDNYDIPVDAGVSDVTGTTLRVSLLRKF